MQLIAIRFDHDMHTQAEPGVWPEQTRTILPQGGVVRHIEIQHIGTYTMTPFEGLGLMT